MKILGLTLEWVDSDYKRIHDAYSGIGYYRIVKPLKAIGQDTIGVKAKDKEYRDLVKGYDAVLIKPINSQLGAKFLWDCKEEGVKVIVDLDDNVFVHREDQGFHEELKAGSEKRAFVGAFISLADALICSTQPLMDFYKDWLKKVHDLEKPMFLLPNYNDIADWNYPSAKKEMVIGWGGTKSHLSDLKMVTPALKVILDRNPDVIVELCGGIDEKDIEYVFPDDGEYLDRIIITPGTPAFDTYPQLLASKNWSIGIAPLIDDEFNRGKSHIKWMEYAMYKIPCVASEVYPYCNPIEGKDTIKNNKTGFLAKGKKDWVKYLQLLIDNQRLRERIGENAYNYVKDNWQFDKDKINKIYKQI